ncbi:zinc finger, CCHC-type containing protein [Tanacetum coccineum]
MGDENHIRTLGDYSKPSHEGYRNTIDLPVGNNVVPLRSDNIRLVQNGCSFHGLWSEDPNQHLKDFLKLVDSLDLDDENRERTRLHLFQFSLRDQASNWFERLPAGSITTWEDLITRFLAQFFPPRRTAKLRNDILMFQQHHGESLSEAWTHFKDLLQKCEIDRAASGKLRNNNAEESWALLEDLAFYDNESWNDPRDFSKLVKYCMEDPDQAFVKYASSRNHDMGTRKITTYQGLKNFNDATNTWKDKPSFNWEQTQTFMSLRNDSIFIHLSNYQIKLEKALDDFAYHQEKRLSSLRAQLRQHQDDIIGKINLLWKNVSEKLNDAYIPKSVGNSMASKNITSISHIEREELIRKGIKSPSKLFS